MKGRREALIRLGARICNTCGSPRDLYQYQDTLICAGCWQQEAMQEELTHQKRMAEMAGKTAIEMSDRPGSEVYRKACAAMEADLAAISEDWKFGNGIF